MYGKISGEEKQAAEFCITHDRDYALTADLFGFTSQQVYSWVRKYHAAGINSLRHERKCPRELSDWVTESKQLKTVNLKLEMELCCIGSFSRAGYITNASTHREPKTNGR